MAITGSPLKASGDVPKSNPSFFEVGSPHNGLFSRDFFFQPSLFYHDKRTAWKVDGALPLHPKPFSQKIYPFHYEDGSRPVSGLKFSQFFYNVLFWGQILQPGS